MASDSFKKGGKYKCSEYFFLLLAQISRIQKRIKSNTDPPNYCPISFLNNLIKLFERMNLVF